MAYSGTVTSPLNDVIDIGGGLGLYAGRFHLVSNHTVMSKIVGITRFFKPSRGSFPHGVIAVVVDGASSLGYTFEWVDYAGAFIAWYPFKINVTSGVGVGSVLLYSSGSNAYHATSATGTLRFHQLQVENDADAGEVSFIAIGLI